MRIQYQLPGLNPRAVTDRPMDRHLEHLERLIPISSAQVVLQHQRDAAPAFVRLKGREGCRRVQSTGKK